MVGDRDGEEDRDNEDESNKRPLGSRFQVVKTEASEKHKNSGVEWGHAIECSAQ